MISAIPNAGAAVSGAGNATTIAVNSISSSGRVVQPALMPHHPSRQHMVRMHAMQSRHNPARLHVYLAIGRGFGLGYTADKLHSGMIV